MTLKCIYLLDEIVHMLKVFVSSAFFRFKLIICGLIPMVGIILIIVMVAHFADEVVSREALIMVHVLLARIVSIIVLNIWIIRRVIHKLIDNLPLGMRLALDCFLETSFQGLGFDVLDHNVFEHASFAVLRMLHRPKLVALQRFRTII